MKLPSQLSTRRCSHRKTKAQGALAQAELENPEKSLTATNVSPFPREEFPLCFAGERP
jgi:hypothetical protein